METSFGYFPDYDVQWDYNLKRSYNTKVKVSKTGKEQRRRMYPTGASRGTGRRGGYARIAASSDAFTPAERAAVASFLDSVDGAFRAFYFFRRDHDTFTDYFVDTITAATSVIIPFKDSSVSAVTVANVSKAFSVTSSIGTGGEDRINFSAGAQTGAVRITCYARERVLVRCESDDVSESFIANTVRNNTVVTLAFKQVE